jgi:hypothetical protein
MQGPTFAMVGLMGTFVVFLVSLVSYSNISGNSFHPIALLSAPAAPVTRSRFSSLSLASDYNMYRQSFRNEMEGEKNNLLTNYNSYRQQFRNEMESSGGMRAPETILAEMVPNHDSFPSSNLYTRCSSLLPPATLSYNLIPATLPNNDGAFLRSSFPVLLPSTPQAAASRQRAPSRTQSLLVVGISRLDLPLTPT